jgi:hypothetical protein
MGTGMLLFLIVELGMRNVSDVATDHWWCIVGAVAGAHFDI